MGTTLNGIRYPELVGVSADVPRDMKALAEDVDDRMYIIGEIRWLAGPAPSARWLAADGASTYLRATYVKLWDYLRQGHAGTPGDPAPWGNGDGSTTFTVVDLAGRSPVGPGQAKGGNIESAPTPPNRLIGTKWGVNAVALTDPRQNADHNHGNTGVTNIDHNHGAGGYGSYMMSNLSVGLAADAGAQPGWFPDGFIYVTGAMVQNQAHAHTTPSSGGGLTHENAMPSVAVPAYIYAGA